MVSLVFVTLAVLSVVRSAHAACGTGIRECKNLHSSSSNDGFVLHLLAPASGALCLDGSPAGFYFRPGRGSDANKFIVENEGGGWCVSLADCWSRAHTDIGSSLNWPPTGCPSMDGGSNAMLSNDCTVNPFCNYSMAHLNYCDGASFSGSVQDPVLVPGTTGKLYFRGQAILDASLAALGALGMSTASEVIWKGCSAGGLSVYLHADYVRASLPPSVRFTAMPDGGFFMDSTSWQGTPSYTPYYQWVAATQNVTGSVNAACVAHYQPTGDTWRCFMAQYTLPFIRSPLYVTQDLDDIWQMQNIALVPAACQSWPPSPACTPTQVNFIHSFRLAMLQQLQPLLAAPHNGGFLTTCLNHCHQNVLAKWQREVVQGVNLVTAFTAWYRGNSTNPVQVDGQLGSNPTCVYGY